jgi:hypothetical protein
MARSEETMMDRARLLASGISIILQNTSVSARLNIDTPRKDVRPWHFTAVNIINTSHNTRGGAVK